jgi:hypothetical protein
MPGEPIQWAARPRRDTGGDYRIMLERISTGEMSLNMIMRSKLPL